MSYILGTEEQSLVFNNETKCTLVTAQCNSQEQQMHLGDCRQLTNLPIKKHGVLCEPCYYIHTHTHKYVQSYYSMDMF